MMEYTFDYMKAADTMMEKGDYVTALHYYFLQRNVDYYSEVDVAIGVAYMEMGLIKEATKYYMYAYVNDNKNTDALEGLVCCYKDIDKDIALYYLHRIVVLDGEDFDFEPEELDMMEEEPYNPSLTLHDRRNKEKLLNEAIDRLSATDIEGGKKLLGKIGKEDFQYCDAQFILATVALDEHRPKKALSHAKNALEVDPKDLGGYMAMAMACESLNKIDEMNEWVAKIDALNVTSEESVSKVALCFINLGVANLALKYYKRKYEFTPFDKNTLVCLASLYSTVDKAKAIKYINKACTIFPENVVLKEIASRIYGGAFIMPRDLMALKKQWHEKIKNIFIHNDEDVCSPENIKIIKWLLCEEDELYLQAAICTYVTGLPEYESIINDLLCDPFASDMVKKQILLRKFIDEKQKKVDFVVGNIYRSIKIRHPRAPENLKSAYYIVLSSLAVEDSYNEAVLDRSLKRLKQAYDRLDDREKLSMGVLAAVLRKMTVGGDEHQYCELYDVDPGEYDDLVQKLDLQGEI